MDPKQKHFVDPSPFCRLVLWLANPKRRWPRIHLHLRYPVGIAVSAVTAADAFELKA